MDGQPHLDSIFLFEIMNVFDPQIAFAALIWSKCNLCFIAWEAEKYRGSRYAIFPSTKLVINLSLISKVVQCRTLFKLNILKLIVFIRSFMATVLLLSELNLWPKIFT